MFWLALLLALGTAAAIAYPLFRPRPRAITEPIGNPETVELAAAKESTYAAIKELEFDYRAGSLSKEDYQDLEARYKRKAVSLLQTQDTQRAATDHRAQIEAEIRRIRARPAGPSTIEEEIRRLRTSIPPQTPNSAGARSATAGRFCTQCGSPSDPGDRFCSYCGHPLPQTRSST